LGQGVTGAVANKSLNENEQKEADQILSAFGKLVWVKKESDIDSVTAISGSGPAYVFLFAEAMMEAAKKYGFTKEQAKKLVFTTIKGSINLAEKSDMELDQLISNVASKGGTTEAALKQFKARNFKKIIVNAADAAKKRSFQLSDK
jgi:pyrroline-5-carboxylate reductase